MGPESAGATDRGGVDQAIIHQGMCPLDRDGYGPIWSDDVHQVLALNRIYAGVFAELKVTARPFVSSTIPQHTHGLVGPLFCLSFARLSLGNALPYDAYPYSATK